MKYFETVYKKQNLLIEIDAPIVLQETAIIKDTVDNLIQLRNIFYNTGTQKIIAIAIRVSQSDVFGESISEPFEYIYEDISFNPQEYFGNKEAIDLHIKTRKVKVDILKAVLEDGTVWVSNHDNIVEIQPQHEIEASDGFIKSIDTNNEKPIFYYAENDSCWQCTCGEPNKLTFLTCQKCHRSREEVKNLFNRDYIHDHFISYINKLEQETTNQSVKENGSSAGADEKDELEYNKKNDLSKKKKRRNGIYIIAAIVVVALIFVISRLSSGKNNDNTSVSDGENVENSAELITETNSTSEISDDDSVLKTKDSLKQYLDIIGSDAANNSLDVSQEFLDGIDKVYVMGKYGTVSHASTEGSGDTITTMDWISNESATREELDEFVDSLNVLFEGNAIIGHYSNISDGDVWAWEITKDNLWPICFLNDGKINVRWYDRSAVNIPGESKSDPSEIINGSSNSSLKTDESSFGNQYISGSIKRQVPQSNSEEELSSNTGAMQNDISYDATLRYGSGLVAVFSSKDSMDRFMTALANNNQGTIDEMIASGDVSYVGENTKCNIVEQHVTWGKVKILEGASAGRTLYVVSEAIQKK